MNEKDDKWDEKTKEKPKVDHLEVGRRRKGPVDALVHGVHDKHDGQRQPRYNCNPMLIIALKKLDHVKVQKTYLIKRSCFSISFAVTIGHPMASSV